MWSTLLFQDLMENVFRRIHDSVNNEKNTNEGEEKDPPKVEEEVEGTDR